MLLKRHLLKALVKKLNRSSDVQITFIILNQSAWDVQSQSWHVKVVDFAPFRGLYVREFELSHSILVNRVIKITHGHNLLVWTLSLLQSVREMTHIVYEINLLKLF